MPTQRVLVSWIGHQDLRSMAWSLPTRDRQAIFRQMKGLNKEEPNGIGPIKTLTEAEEFSQVHLLCNYPDKIGKQFTAWIGKEARLHKVDLDNPTDYNAIFDIADRGLRSITESLSGEKIQLCIHLSPGSPAMAAIWVLLGKSRYPATFYQTHKGKAWVEDIPFDLAVDFVPELLRGPDSALQHLASQSPQEVEGFEKITGDSKSIRLAVGRAKRAAIRDVSVLLLGESGTGKEMFARAVHAASHRRDNPFMAMNCAAIPRELLESELFGHRKGAFTGAVEDRKGAFEAVNGGTLFLDEIGECDAAMQSKLLRALQPPAGGDLCKRVFRRVGDTKDMISNVRVIAATNRNLMDAVSAGIFRDDLFYRLAVITIKLPPLRHRKTDITKLAQKLLDQINREFEFQDRSYKHKRLCTSTNTFLRQQHWPGNVRQLHNVLLQAVVMAQSDTITKADVEAALAEVPGTVHLDAMEHPLGEGFCLIEYLEGMQRHYLKRAMQEAGGVKTKAARLLGMKNYQTLDAQLKRLGVRM